ncbi:hypothetical protein CTI12_AA146930 [Artemisia annua]|uniref:Uncharacterized protein n=1 Tax=Artemisia annua TaxID=35608 RepID=A0A2U1PJ39_ARTAN|nr:hypothetical protein CTI12_AA146930 [Artemisia annua]
MNGNSGAQRKMGAPLSNRPKDRDEDLVMFQEMHKRDKNRVVNLLQPVSDEFEPNGNYPIYGMSSSAKKGPGLGFLGESDKTDYNWLKTPPATPLFPSLEMETKNAHELVVQRELPIIQPLSRFAEKPEEKETKQIHTGAIPRTPKPTTPRPRVPTRSVTPSGRSSSLFTDNKKNIKTAPIQLTSSANKTSDATDLTLKPSITSSNSKPLGANLSKSYQGPSSSSKTTQKTRGVSPLVTSRITQIPGFSNETPPNLRTDRSISASRVRPISQNGKTTPVAAPQKPDVSTMKGRRQSCSPSVTRGRKVAPNIEENTSPMTPQKGSSNRMFQTGNGGHFLGSRMVDKIMNARKLNDDKKPNGSINEGSGYGRIVSKGSVDLETKRNSVSSRQVGTSLGRKSISTTYAPSSRSNGGSYRAL